MAQMITGYSYRKLSLRVADNRLFQWLTYTDRLGKIIPLSRSSVERFEKLFTDKKITQLIHDFNRPAEDDEPAVRRRLDIDPAL